MMAKRKKVIGITRGTFQILHAGHCRFLDQASRLVDELHVFIDVDKRVEELKGECLVNVEDRATVLSCLSSVYAVYTFLCEEDFQEQLNHFDYWGPNSPTFVYFKGGDYNPNDLKEKEFLENKGIIVCCLTHSGHSTSDLVKRIRNG